MNYKNILFNTLKAVIILIAAFCISLFMDSVFSAKSVISSVFVLAVFMVTVSTDGCIYGIISSLISVLAVNYAFTFPFFAFNFKIHENIISAIILIIITISASTLTTEIKRHEKIKMRAEKERLRADLLRAVSHDLRTPLTTIYGSASTVTDNYDNLPDTSKLEIISGIKKDARWLIRMVENLLSVTKLDSGGVNLQKNSVVLEELIDTVLSKFKKHYPFQNVLLDLPEEFITVSADAMLISQVLLNLLENAVAHAIGMTKLSLRIYTDEKKAYFEVSDDGCGIEKDRLKHIFSGYYMVDNTIADTSAHRMGIGLSVCAAIINAHGGKITAENAPGGGMIFKFYLEKEEDTYEQQI